MSVCLHFNFLLYDKFLRTITDTKFDQPYKVAYNIVNNLDLIKFFFPIKSVLICILDNYG